MITEFVKRTQESIARSRATLAGSGALLKESNQLCAMLRSLIEAQRDRKPSSGLGRWMTPADELRQIKNDQVRMERDSAARTRRLAITFWSADDRDRALKLAGELDAQADELARALAEELAGTPRRATGTRLLS